MSQEEKKQEHTPGPWKMNDWGDHEIEVFHMVGNCKVAVCDLAQEYDGHGRGTNTRIEADARLISAAPDMLEALSAVVSCGAFAAGVFGPGGESDRAYKLAKAAIAKAEGKA